MGGYTVPTYGVWDSFDEIDFKTIPNQFVLKCTHDSGGLVICKDKNTLNLLSAKQKIQHSMKQNFFYFGREWPYKNVKPRIMAEKYLADETGDLRDYKLHCFNGKLRITLVCSDRLAEDGLKEDFYDNRWTHLNMRRPGKKNSKTPIEKPTHFDLMRKLAEQLTKDMPFARVDFYEVNHQIYFGEITFYPATGIEGFCPKEWDARMGKWLKLPVDS